MEPPLGQNLQTNRAKEKEKRQFSGNRLTIERGWQQRWQKNWVSFRMSQFQFSSSFSLLNYQITEKTDGNNS